MRNELALLRWRSNGTWACPAVIRVATGGYLTGGSVYHSQNGESSLPSPTLRESASSSRRTLSTLMVSCAWPSAAMTECLLEHKRLYRETYGRAPYPGPDYMIPFGKAAKDE